MDVTVDLTANHKGYFEFSICPNNDVNRAASDDCFFPLSSKGGKSQFKITTSMGSRKLFYQLQLPSNLICSQCIVRWHYKAGNSWNCDQDGRCGMGLGPQETFRGCADIEIIPQTVHPDLSTSTEKVLSTDVEESLSTSEVFSTTSRSTSATTSTSTSTTTSTSTSSTTSTTTSTTTTVSDKDRSQCEAVGLYKNVYGMTEWCRVNCFHVPSFCPSSHCLCS